MSTGANQMSATRGPAITALAGAIAFVGAFVAINVVQSTASTPLPMPNAPDAEVYRYLTDNTVTVGLNAAVLLLSACALAVYVRSTRRAVPLSHDPRSLWGHRAGMIAVVAMAVAGGLGFVLALAAGQLSVDTAVALRQANFIAGGVAHVAFLGGYVGLTSRAYPSRGIRVFGIVAMVPALLSLTSLVVFAGSVFILIGRLLCMAWIITAAVAVVRARPRVTA